MRRLHGLILGSFALILSVALAQPAFAQQQQQQQMQNGNGDSGGVGVGVEALAGFPSISNVDPSLNAKTSYGFGLWVGGNRNGRVGFVGEFIYLIRKEELGTETAKHQALEIPAVFHVNIGSRNKNGLLGYAVLGPVFTINVKNTLSGGLTGNNFSSADVGLIYGAGIEFARISVEGRMNQGFRSVTDNGGGAFQDSKERSFELLGKIRFN